MKKFGIATGLAGIIGSALAAAVVGLAAPASAGVDHHSWLNQVTQRATAPQVDTTVHQSR
ncbi:hypothetical protein M1247_00070 [Mycobacterium sp. 21AC1]|uniref:hypothetical protein n=1 Tax=[Mycobacterium] appelbergii TaxID=2939269 RepID=UPI0029392643|nr:hypothetical protein [Mycobacterium sp. 21AC1]MDV3123296.1 hypothetical protein [Mycobacterium sp. 21AC1]